MRSGHLSLRTKLGLSFLAVIILGSLLWLIFGSRLIRNTLIAQAQAGNYDGDRGNISEMDAIVAYLQVLGTMVDFSKYDNDEFVKFR